jgi:glycosyltransferase involved in cell wall biosynthesis
MDVTKKKKIIFLLPTLFQGGGERVVSELSLCFSSRMEVVIVVFEEKITYPFGGRIVSLGVPLSTNLIAGAYLFFIRLLRLCRVLAKEKPDYVISLAASANILSLLAAKNPIVHVDIFISEARKGFRGAVFKMLVRFLFPRAGRIVAVSQDIAQDLVSTFRIPAEKIQVIHNPIDIAKIEKRGQESLQPHYEEIFQHPVVITMGRLRPQKGQWHLIRAFAEVKKSIKDAKLILLGEGPLQKELKDLTKKLGVQSDVYFLGWQENPFAFLKRSNVFVLSSLWEGLPDVLLEALACGLPAVSFDCRSGPREILAPSTDTKKQINAIEYGNYGVLVPIKNEKLLAESIKKVLSEPGFALEFSGRAQKRARDFDIQTIMPQWNFLYEDRMD